MSRWELVLADRTIDITDDVMVWEVEWGCQNNPDSGQWGLVTARGAMTVDSLSGRFVQGHENYVLTPAEFTGPIRIRYGPTAGAPIWTGLVHLAPANLIGDPLAVMRWRLSGNYSALWRNQYPHRHVSYADVVASYPSPLEFAKDMVEAAGRSFGFGIQAGRIVPEGGVAGRLTDQNSDVPDIQWVYPSVQGTVGQNWADCARWAASIPYETRDGRLGMKSLPDILGAVTPVEPTMRARRDGSTLSEHPPDAPWGIRVSGPKAVAALAAETLGTVAVTLDDRDDDTTEFVGTAEIDQPFGEGVLDILWTRNPTPPTGATTVTVTVEPLARRAGDRLMVEVRATTRPSGPLTVTLTGRKVTSQEIITTPVLPSEGNPAAELGDSGWTWYGAAEPVELTAFTTYIGALNRVQDRFNLVYDLFDRSGVQLVPNGHTEVGTQAVFQVSDTLTVQGLIERVRLRGSRSQLPKVEIRGTGLLGRSTIPEPPPEPEEATDAASAPHAGTGDPGFARFKGVFISTITRRGETFHNYAIYDAEGQRHGNIAFFGDSSDSGYPVSRDTLSWQALWPMGKQFFLTRQGTLTEAQRAMELATGYTLTVGTTTFSGELGMTNHRSGLATPGLQGMIVRPNAPTIPDSAAWAALWASPPATVEFTVSAGTGIPAANQVVTPATTPMLPPEFDLPPEADRDDTNLDFGTAGTTPTRWNGRDEDSRSNSFVVVHTAENSKPATDGSIEDVINYLLGVQRYAGYHLLVDLGGYTLWQDPRTRRAYHARNGGNDGIGLAFCLKTSDWANLTAQQTQTLLGWAGLGLQFAGQTSGGWTHPATWDRDNPVTKGVYRHSQLQGDRSDPGDDFPMTAMLALFNR